MSLVEINPNDFINSISGVAVSVWYSGCQHRCPGCHNPNLWEDKGTQIVNGIDKVLLALSMNGVNRDLAILGGEPLDSNNLAEVQKLIQHVRAKKPQTRIYLWTGYIYEELQLKRENSSALNYILSEIDILIDGPYKQELRALNIPLRGSTNQRILYRHLLDFSEKISYNLL